MGCCTFFSLSTQPQENQSTYFNFDQSSIQNRDAFLDKNQLKTDRSRWAAGGESMARRFYRWGGKGAGSKVTAKRAGQLGKSVGGWCWKLTRAGGMWCGAVKGTGIGGECVRLLTHEWLMGRRKSPGRVSLQMMSAVERRNRNTIWPQIGFLSRWQPAHTKTENNCLTCTVSYF